MRHILNSLLVVILFLTINIQSFAQKIDPNDYDIAYVREGSIRLYSIIGSKGILVEMNKDVFNFVFNEDLSKLYFTTIEDNNKLSLYCAHFNERIFKVEKLVDLNADVDIFKTDTYREKSRIRLINDTIFLECGFSWDTYSFEGYYSYSLNSKKLSINDDFFGFDLLERNEEDTIQSKLTDISDKITTEYIKEKPVLKYNKKSISNLFDYEISEDFYQFDFKVSPNKKGIVYSFLTQFGDLPHGPYCYASLDGKFQTVLTDNGIASTIKEPLWAFNGNYIIYLDSIEEQAKLMALNTITNEIITIDGPVDFFQVLKK